MCLSFQVDFMMSTSTKMYSTFALLVNIIKLDTNLKHIPIDNKSEQSHHNCSKRSAGHAQLEKKRITRHTVVGH